MMNKFSFALFVLLACCISCQNGSNKVLSIKELGDIEHALIKKISQQQAHPRLDTMVLHETKQYLEKCEAFAEKNPNDPATVGLLYKSGEVAKSVGLYGLAIRMWGIIQREHPKDPKAGDALFMQAFTFENDLRDTESAKKYYHDFLTRFPSHQFADDAKQLLQLIDKSPEELIKEFESKNEPKAN